VLVLKSHLVPRSTYEHGEIAENLLAGRGFSVKFLGAQGPTSQQAPLYPALVAGAYALGGVGTSRALLILQLGQAALGGVLVLAVIWLANEALPGRPRLALLAGLIAAIHPTLVYAATHVQVAPLATLWLTLALAAAYQSRRTGAAGDALATGLLLALLVLTDPILGLVFPALLWIIVRADGARRSLRPVAILAITAMFGVAPWIVRNYRVHGEFVFVKSTFGYAFWQGNCALSQGTDKVVRASVERALNQTSRGDLRGWNDALWKARHEAGYIDDIALSKADYAELSRLSEPARSRLLFRRALTDLRARPGRFAQLCARRLRYFLFFDETNPKTRSVVYRASHMGLTLLAALGWVVMGTAARARLAPTLLAAALITIFHTLTIVSARFHIPLEPLMGVWAAAGLDCVLLTALGTDIDRVGIGHSILARGTAASRGRRRDEASIVRGNTARQPASENRAANHGAEADRAGGRPRHVGL
jgi:4-amino-4-deoxy-L-arabinose transferase-like glycosyltransferase